MSEETSSRPDHGSPIDQFVDELLPGELEWRRLAGDYPLATLAVAVAGGFWIGRQHGRALLRAASDFLSREMTRNVQGLFDGLAGEPGRSPRGTASPQDAPTQDA